MYGIHSKTVCTGQRVCLFTHNMPKVANKCTAWKFKFPNERSFTPVLKGVPTIPRMYRRGSRLVSQLPHIFYKVLLGPTPIVAICRGRIFNWGQDNRDHQGGEICTCSMWCAQLHIPILVGNEASDTVLVQCRLLWLGRQDLIDRKDLTWPYRTIWDHWYFKSCGMP